MAFAHCHTCGWQQDDFWHKGYSPLHGSHFDSVRDELLDSLQKAPEDRYIVVDVWWAKEVGLPYEEHEDGAHVRVAEHIAWELERYARNLRTMIYWTDDDFQNAGRICPQCGESLCVD